MFVLRSPETGGLLLLFFKIISEEVHSCLWQDCGFCSVESDGEMLRHMLFHCYHTKLKQWGSAMLKAHPDMGDCSVGLQNRNIVPEVQESFLCLWEHCEVRGNKIDLHYVQVVACVWLPQAGISTHLKVHRHFPKNGKLIDFMKVEKGSVNECFKDAVIETMHKYLHFQSNLMMWPT